MNLIIADR